MSNENQAPVAAEEKANSMLWEDLDTGAVRKEFSKVCDDLDALGNEIEKLAKESTNVEQTQEYMDKVRDVDLGSSGFISSFIRENTTSFPSINGPKRGNLPDWYYMLLPDKRKKYDDILNFLDDAVKLSAFFKPFAGVLKDIPLKNAFRLFPIVRNMLRKKYDQSEYERINKDIKGVNEVLTLGWNVFSNKTGASEKFYQDNIAQMDSPKMKERYIKLRMEEYNAVYSAYDISKIIKFQGYGNFNCDGWIAKEMNTLDAYMGKVIQNKDIGGRLTAIISDMDKLADSLMANIVLSTSSGRELHQTMKNAVIKIRFFLIRSLEEFNKFQEGSTSEAPYCYMTCPEEAGKSQGWFGFSPAWSDSWSGGTKYLNMYKQALYAIKIQCKEYTYTHGRVK